MKRTFIFYPEWLDYIELFKDDAVKLDLYKAVIEYGCTGEYSSEKQETIAFIEGIVKPKIDLAQSHYNEKVNGGKTSGRKKTVDDEQIRMMAKQGQKAKDIAQALGISEPTVYHSEGWRNRNL